MDAIRLRRIRHIPRQARRLRGDEGFAVPIVMLMLLAAFALVSVGVVAASNTQRGTVRDQDSKAALQLAETGINQAILRYNYLTPVTGNLCSPLGTSPISGWCQVGPVTDASGGTYSYQVFVGAGTEMPEDDQGNLELKIVGTGTMGDATRRVLTDAKSLSTNVFGEYQVKAGEDVVLDSNSSIRANTAAGGDITLHSNASQCGQASVGIGHNMNRDPNTTYASDPECQNALTSVGHDDVSLPSINAGDIPVDNDNDHFFTQDPLSGNKATACWNGLNANGTTGTCGARHLSIGGNSSVTLTGSTYSFCKLSTSSNSSLLVTGGQKVTIYFDSPENCGYTGSEPMVQLDMNSNSRISSNDGTPVQLLFVGSPNIRTTLYLSSNTDIEAACQQNIIIYAPLSDVVLNSNSTYCGALAGRTIRLDSNAELRFKDAYELILQPVIAYYEPHQFVECRAAPATAPNFDAGC